MLKGILAGLAAGALWGLVFVAPSMTPGLSSVDLIAGRFVVFGVMAALVMVFTRATHKLPTTGQALAALGMSVLGFTGYYLLLVLAIHRAGTGVPALIIGTIPIWVMLLGKPIGLKWATLLPGLLLTAAGLVLMMNVPLGAPQAEQAPSGSHYWQGIALVVAAAASWTAFAILNAAWLKRHPEVNATEWANWLGIATGAGAVLLWLVAGSSSKELLALDNIGLAAIVCVATGIGSAWIAAILWNIASQRLSASLCGQLIVSETLFALLYSLLWDGAWPGELQLLAAVLFTLGILASIRAHR
ncbi:DMT family transporter [Rhodoferax sp.]|uniref:DMT family transporter n=1 Tax=Rhodoferax sp. TaxID=50421 RepID=UPI0027183A06|nr:DMT family transporter [Rhodoferax sp.]MDO9198239.1 DMT family transporter [Rhodoferax sp.]